MISHVAHDDDVLEQVAECVQSMLRTHGGGFQREQHRGARRARLLRQRPDQAGVALLLFGKRCQFAHGIEDEAVRLRCQILRNLICEPVGNQFDDGLLANDQLSRCQPLLDLAPAKGPGLVPNG